MPAIALLCLLASAVASVSFAADPPKNARGWNEDVKLAEAVDVNPAPDVVEVSLTARVADVPIGGGRFAPAWTYDGGLPGPLIRAKVGDRLIVHFRNQLPQATTVHWHGLRVPIEMDGVPEISQDAVPTGGGFDYDFVLRDAGLFWYHPHVMSAAQVGFGLYGALLVEDPAERSLLGDLDELVLVLSDISLSPSGALEPPDSGGSAGMVFGREGNDVLVNGRVRPRIRARPGVLQRWRVVNTARSRFFLLQIDGLRFIQIGGDGGLREAATTLDTVLVTPGERVDLLVLPTGPEGTSLLLTSMLYNRGYGSIEYRLPEDLLTWCTSTSVPASGCFTATSSTTPRAGSWAPCTSASHGRGALRTILTRSPTDRALLPDATLVRRARARCGDATDREDTDADGQRPLGRAGVERSASFRRSRGWLGGLTASRPRSPES